MYCLQFQFNRAVAIIVRLANFRNYNDSLFQPYPIHRAGAFTYLQRTVLVARCWRRPRCPTPGTPQAAHARLVVQDDAVALSLDVNCIKTGSSVRTGVACFLLCYTLID